MGALFKQNCYASNSEALDAFYSGFSVVHTAGRTSYREWYEKPSGTWLLKRQSIASDGTVTDLSSSVAPVLSFPTCNVGEEFLDGMTVGWGIALAMLLAWSWKLMEKATR